MNPETGGSARDDGLEWLRAIRRQMAAEANNDPRIMGQQLREMEKLYARRMVRSKKSLESTATK